MLKLVKIGTWKIQPLKNEIILILIRYKGEMLDSDLLREIQRVYNDMNRQTLNKILFSLEVEMVIKVERISKTKNRIQLLENAPINEQIKKYFFNGNN